MHITFSALFSFINLSLSLALRPRDPTTSSVNTDITPPSRYYLETRVLESGHDDKDHLFVSSYHTGPLETPPQPSLLSFPSHIDSI